MTEIIFWVENDPEGGYVAKAIGEPIFTQANSLPELRQMVKDSVECHYPDEATRPKMIRLHNPIIAQLKLVLSVQFYEILKLISI